MTISFHGAARIPWFIAVALINAEVHFHGTSGAGPKTTFIYIT